LGLAALAMAVIGIEGCANGQFCGLGGGGCGGGGGGGLFRPFQRRATVIEGCEPGLMEGPIEATPISPGGLLPAPTSAPVTEEPSTLTPAPTSGARPNPTGSRSSSTPSSTSTGSTGRAVYETQADRSRGGPNSARLPAGSAAKGVDPLADLPSLSPPAEGSTASSPPIPPSAEETGVSSKGTGSDAGAGGSESAPSESVGAIPAELPPSAIKPTGSLAPGISRFKVMEPRLAAGSLPSDAGWSWLAETGYKTVLDLRAPSEVKSAEIAAIDHEGLRYIALPLNPAAIDQKHMERFYAEIGEESARPLYFFDSDGVRAAAVWYIHQVEKKSERPEMAERGVSELGPIDTVYLGAANAYLQSRKPAESAPSATTRTEPSARLGEAEQASAGSTEADLEGLLESAIPPLERVIAETRLPAGMADLASEVAGRVDTSDLDRPTNGAANASSWRTMAAIVATGLGFPLVFMGGRELVSRRREHRASLTESVRRTAALPGKSAP
jgi:protein tyrosine phosphatase (PTP) superfamily phosphohydrolase (DUF442 family)